MSATVAGNTQGAEGLDAEWRRLELLGHCLSEARQGRAVSGEALDGLREVQRRVDWGRREAGLWNGLAGPSMGDLELDVLACVAGPEVEPRLGWLFQGLQPGASQPYPTPALVRELFRLGPEDLCRLYAAIGEGGRLRRDRLIGRGRARTYEPIRPGPALLRRLRGAGACVGAPPGASLVAETASWDDLVLPAPKVAALREVLHWVRHRGTVVGEWGGAACGGPVALFSGPSGTGKTFAATVLAGDLEWPLYRVDLGRLVSKYLGQTEKNLNRLFDGARGRRAVLLFDEADSLFGRRGEIREARDRYANLEVSHLLSRIELHDGPCILTTNLRGQLDPAFVRRFQLVLEFPRPAPETEPGSGIACFRPERRGGRADPSALGAAVDLNGGMIRNAALHAAYLAASEGSARIELHHIALAVHRELGKSGQEATPARMGPLADHVRPEKSDHVED